MKTITALFALIVSVGVQINLPLVLASFTTLDEIASPDTPSPIISNYIVELESSASQDSLRKRSSNVSLPFWVRRVLTQ